jgi:hypothetical protein
LIVTRRAITDPVEVAALNAALLDGLELYLRRNRTMFRKKTKAFTPDNFKHELNDLIDRAEAAHIGRPAILSVLENVMNAIKYTQLMNAKSSYHTTSVISAPPSTSSVDKIRDFIRGH